MVYILLKLWKEKKNDGNNVDGFEDYGAYMPDFSWNQFDDRIIGNIICPDQ